MDVAKKLALLKEKKKIGWMVGDEKENYACFQVKKEIIFLCTMEKHGPDHWMAHSCSFVGLQSL